MVHRHAEIEGREAVASSSMRDGRPTVVIAAVLVCLEALVAASSQPPSLLAKLPSGSLKGQHGRRGLVVASASPPAGGEEPLLMGPIPVLWSLGSTAVQSIKGVFGGSPPAVAGGEVSSSKRSSGDDRASAAAQPAGQSSSSSTAGAASAKKGGDVLEGGSRVLEQKLEKKLWDACRWGETRRVQELIKKGADVGARDQYDWLRWGALHQAVAFEQPAVVEVLLMAGADPDLPDWDHYTPLHYAAYIGGPRHAAIARALLRYGGQLHPHTWDGKTPRDLSVTYGSHAVLEVLDAARKDELRRMNPLVRLFKGGVPRCRLDTDGVRRGRKRFLEQLTRLYPEPIPQIDIERNEVVQAAQKDGTLSKGKPRAT